MFARVPAACLRRWGRFGSSLALAALPLYASCTQSEDTEPFVPSVQGAKQPKGGGELLGEEEACERLLSAAEAAYARLRCPAPSFLECPAFLRPGGGSGCYEYRAGSVEACEDAYEAAASCRGLSLCVATAELNLELSTCEQVSDGAGGAGGAGGAPAGGAGPAPGGAGGEAPVAGGSGAGGDAGAQGGSDAGGQPSGGAGG